MCVGMSLPCLPHLPCHAAVRFIDAASRYYELSSITTRTVGGLGVAQDDLIGGRQPRPAGAELAAAVFGVSCSSLYDRFLGCCAGSKDTHPTFHMSHAHTSSAVCE